jgi:hypothetical protein
MSSDDNVNKELMHSEFLCLFRNEAMLNELILLLYVCDKGDNSRFVFIAYRYTL